MFSKLPFRTKLVLVVSVPLFVLVGFAGMGIASRFSDLSEQEQYGRLVEPFDQMTLVSRALGDESVASGWYSAAPDDPEAQNQLEATRATTDVAVKALRPHLKTVRDDAGRGALTMTRQLLEQLDTVSDLRDNVDALEFPADSFTTLANQTLDVASTVASNVDDSALAKSMQGIVDLRRSQVAQSLQSTYVEQHLVTGTSDGAPAWAEAIAAEETQIDRFLASSGGAERDAFARGSSSAGVDPVRDAASSDAEAVFPQVDLTPQEYNEAYRVKQGAIDQAVADVETVVDATADQKVSDARNDATLFALFTAGVIGLVLFLALALVRSLNRPLRALTRAARDVSERRLPQLVDTLQQGGELAPGQLEELSPIRIDSPDEFGELATAFNTIQHVTVAVAEQQSALLRKGIGDLYVNLARRNQSLLDRQISLLDDMESREQRTDELGSLFELDQLATRMRRNAESLLVLAGAEQPRQWRTAVPVLDVVRGAAGEIADFARVTYFGFDDDTAVVGNAVADVTHLLAELLENATGFAPPQTPVVVTGQALDRRFLVTITDEGIGMDDVRLAEANSLLARPPAAGLALSRTLGLHVVSHLAARHGIHVQLRKVPNAGVSAVVSLPATVLAPKGDMPPLDPPPATFAPAGDASAPPQPRPMPMPRRAAPNRAGAFVDTSEITWRPAPGPRRTAPTPTPAGAPTTGTELPRRVPVARATPHDVAEPSPNGDAPPPPNGTGEPPQTGLRTRVPGANLTHVPDTSEPVAGREARPRPERVQELLSRHQHGVREGRDLGGDS